VTIAMDLSDLMTVVGGEDHLSDPARWRVKGVRHVDPLLGRSVRRRLAGIILRPWRMAAKVDPTIIR
jgi:hypothetical protein